MSSLFKSLGGLSANKVSQAANPFRGGEVFIGQVLQLIKDNTLDEEGNSITAQYPTTTGLIRFNRLGDPAKPENQIKFIAQPLDKGHYRLPLLGEQVLLTKHLGKYYYFTVVTSTLNMISNIDPNLLLNEYQSSSEPAILVDTETQKKRFESRLDLTTAVFESKNHLPTKVREGDSILEGRLGGVIKMTQTITKPDVWNRETQITNIGQSDDGHPMLIIKATAKTKSSDDIDLTGLEDEDIDNENSSVYLTSTQNVPLSLASSKKFFSWTIDLPAKGSSRIEDIESAVLSSLIPEAFDPNEKVQINVNMPLYYRGSGGGGTVAQSITKDIVDYKTIVATVIDKLEGGYWHPAMYLDGRLKPDGAGLYKNSGETMMGIDRYAGSGLRDTPAGKQFWSLIDNAVPPAGTPWIKPGSEYQTINLSSLSGAAQTWKWGYRGGALEAQLRTLAGDMIYPTYIQNTKAYMDKATSDLVQSDGRLIFHFTYACWNGPGWFQKFANDMDKAVKSGITDTNQLCLVAMNSRVKEGYEIGSKPNKLIAQGGRKICDIIGVPIPV